MLTKKRIAYYCALVLGGFLVLGATVWGVEKLRARLALGRAEAMLQKGFGALATEIIDDHRYSMPFFGTGCQVMLASYFSSRRVERLEWAAQHCLERGRDIPEVYLALASHREFTNRENEALNILNAAAQRFDKIPDLYYRMGQILQRNKNHDAAVQAVLRAVDRTNGTTQITVDALQYFVTLQRWTEAKAMADKIKAAPTDDPELKLLIARALKQGGDPAGAQSIIDQAKGLLATKPDVKARLEQTYGDLLGSGSATAAKPSSGGGLPPGAPPIGGPPPGSPGLPPMAPGMPPGGIHAPDPRGMMNPPPRQPPAKQPPKKTTR